MVSLLPRLLQPPALESSLLLLLLVQPLAQLAGSGWSSEQSPRTPPLRRRPQQPRRGGTSPARSAPSAGSELSPPDSYPEDDPECASRAGPGSRDRAPLHVTTPSPTPEGGAGRTPERSQSSAT